MPDGLSIIIPTFNEADHIERLIRHLLQLGPVHEVIVADGGSTDNTRELARQAGAKVLQSPVKGRAPQMNAGAREATGHILYFLHADTFPPIGYQAAILESCTPAHGAGCFRLQFKERHWFLRLNAWFTRFDINSIRFGDQSLYIRKSYFEQIGGFREDHIVLEDQEIIRRIRKHTGFKVLPIAVETSARKYLQNGVYRLQFVFLLIWLLYRLGLPQKELLRIYNGLVRNSKLKG